MPSTSTRLMKSSIVILSVLYYTFFPLLPRPLNTLILPISSNTSTSTYFQYIIGYILCEQCFLILFHRQKPSRVIFVSLFAVAFNLYVLWHGVAGAGNSEEAEGAKGRGSLAEWSVLVDVLRNMGILFMARDISRPSFASSDSGSGSRSSSSKSNPPLRLSLSQTLPWRSCILWSILFVTSAWYNISGLFPTSGSNPSSQVLLSRLSYDQFQTVWNVLFARLMLPIPWRSIVLGITTQGEMRMMIFNMREKRVCGLEGCGFGWEEEFMDVEREVAQDFEGEVAPDFEILEEGEVKRGHGAAGEVLKTKGRKETPFDFSCNLNVLLSMLGGLAVLARFGWGIGWALVKGIDGYFS
ncbi:hypothetical protein DL98DRAFT_590965 [Cadophora sp. DSE1049]|nr:hypothetical protein DL98DRAFT_590965 [Cadophora sp. DSE1049]